MRGQPPVVWERAEDIFVYDKYGNRWLVDMLALPEKFKSSSPVAACRTAALATSRRK